MLPHHVTAPHHANNREEEGTGDKHHLKDRQRTDGFGAKIIEPYAVYKKITPEKKRNKRDYSSFKIAK